MTQRTPLSSALIAVVLLSAVASPLSAQWTTENSTDEMTGQKSCYAHSASTPPTKRMGFPYRDVRAWLGVACNGETEWAYIGFSESPNLLNSEPEDGYSRILTRIKWDDKIESVALTQEWGSKFLSFEYDADAIARIASASSVLVELDWYGSERVYFRFSLGGSTAAISKIRDACGGP